LSIFKSEIEKQKSKIEICRLLAFNLTIRTRKSTENLLRPASLEVDETPKLALIGFVFTLPESV